MSSFAEVYANILKQQNLVLKSQVITEGFLGSLKELGNIVGGVGDSLTSLSKGDLKGVAKGVWKTVSAPIGAITELGQPSLDDLNAEYEKVKKADFEKNEALKKALEEGTKEIKDDDIIDQFTNWSEAGKEFVENLKKELGDEAKVKSVLRKIIAFRLNEKALKEQEERIKKAEEKNKEIDKKGEEEDNAEQGDNNEAEADELNKFKEIFVSIIPGKEELFDKRIKEGFVLIVKASGKIGKFGLDKVKASTEKYLKYAEKCKDKAIEARKAAKAKREEAKKKNLDDAKKPA